MIIINASFLHDSFSLFLAFFIAFFRLPILFLYALQTYIHPDTQPSTSNGLRATIRRPSTSEGPTPDLRNRLKNKDKFDFDEKNAQIFRPRLDHTGFWVRITPLCCFKTSILLVFLVAFMGFLSLVLFIPAAKIGRSFWLGTNQIRCNLSIITCGWFGCTILYIFVNNSNLNKNNSKGGSEVGNAEKLLGNMGFSPSDVRNFRWWYLFGSNYGIKAKPSDGKDVLHNHYLCLVVLQFLSPPVLVLLFLGLSQIDVPSIANLLLLSVEFIQWSVEFIAEIL
ncbi:hypothetical protein Ahy_A09g044869 [Arachis hypogaea]|uniref:Uncharacterized protein n=1 Tax=Arachis hypogaea TaxID=3818 RepID=A0A445BKZ9_ARAHY|nr:hypothetical protein Ahy_A09g044869 [Arachis hypogaea]